MKDEIKKLIDVALTDGVLTQKERDQKKDYFNLKWNKKHRKLIWFYGKRWNCFIIQIAKTLLESAVDNAIT